MNFKKIVTLTAFGIIGLASCKNNLNIQAPYKDITVVYGLMDQNDAVHYIRINKAFEGNGNAYTMAKQYDSIYYPISAINAVLEDSNPNTSATTIIKLDTTTTVPLASGTFSYPKQLLYYTTATLNPNDYYNILIANTKTGKVLRGSTALLQDITFTNANLYNRNNPLDLESAPQSTTIGWQSLPNALIYQMTLVFYYDAKIGSGARTPQTPLQLVFQQQTAPSSSANMSYSITCQQLFTLITSSLQPVNGISRYADSLGIIFTSGTADLNTYIQLSQPPTGINQDVPSFSNVANGVGLYTARHIQTIYKTIDKNTLDSLEGTVQAGDQEARFRTLGFTP